MLSLSDWSFWSSTRVAYRHSSVLPLLRFRVPASSFELSPTIWIGSYRPPETAQQRIPTVSTLSLVLSGGHWCTYIDSHVEDARILGLSAYPSHTQPTPVPLGVRAPPPYLALLESLLELQTLHSCPSYVVSKNNNNEAGAGFLVLLDLIHGVKFLSESC